MQIEEGYFSNQLPDLLRNELLLADRLDVKPLRVSQAGFDEIINGGTIKWAVTENGQLLVIPKYVNGQEISHTALTRGQPVLAAGEAEIVGDNGKYVMLEINNNSGHYRPSSSSLEIGKQAFRQNGIEPTP